MIAAASFIAATGFEPSPTPAWRMKIFDTPEPEIEAAGSRRLLRHARLHRDLDRVARDRAR